MEANFDNRLRLFIQECYYTIVEIIKNEYTSIFVNDDKVGFNLDLQPSRFEMRYIDENKYIKTVYINRISYCPNTGIKLYTEEDKCYSIEDFLNSDVCILTDRLIEEYE